ncbi:hypothetical protein Plhal304r1_c018g0065551 [Plasmopara halstedii]
MIFRLDHFVGDALLLGRWKQESWWIERGKIDPFTLIQEAKILITI